jgi:hypothetical protein
MIKVRYRDSNELSPGLHAAAERHGRTTMVYLLSGLTKPQRRSALRRLRLSARMGHCPGLPAGQLALALFADRIRTGIGRAGAVLRLHPAGSTLPIMVLSGGAIAFLLFSTVSIRVLHPTPASPEAASGPNPVATAGAVPITGSEGGVAGLPGSGSRPATPPGLGGSSLATGPSLAGIGPNAAPGSGGNGTGTGQGSTGTSGSTGTGTGSRSSGGSGGGTTLTGGTDPAPASAQGTTGGGAGGGTGSGTGSSTGSGGSSSTPASQAPAAPPQPAPSATHAASSGVCLKVGPLGLCLNV